MAEPRSVAPAADPGVPLVKICGLARNEDARAAERLGADFLGVVLTAGFGRSVAPERAAEVVAGTSTPRVAVVVDETAATVAERARSIGASVVQLHGDEDRAHVRALREEGDWRVWKAVRAASPEDLRRVVERVGDGVDGFLVEGRRGGVVGGGGLRLDVDPEELRAELPEGVTFVLAGGLTPDGVAEAVARFAPDVVDVSSGVERVSGRKDHALVAAFIRSARSAAR